MCYEPAVLVAAHVFEVLLLVIAPLAFGRVWARRRGWEAGMLWAGLLVFFVADALEIGAAKGISWLFRAELLPAPGRESADLVDAILAGVVGALLMEAARLYALRSLVERPSRAAGLLVGLGQGAGQALVQGLTVLAMAIIALVFEGKTFEDMAELGIEGGAAVKIGLKAFAWWEGKPIDAVVAGAEALAMVTWHVGLGALLAAGMRAGRSTATFALVVFVHALLLGGVVWLRESGSVGLAPHLPYVVAALGGVGLAWWSSRGEEPAEGSRTVEATEPAEATEPTE